MNFTEQELVAMTHLGLLMAAANGEIVELEKNVIQREITAIGINLGINTEDRVKSLFDKVRRIQPTEAIATLLSMQKDKQKYILNYLETVMRADGSIDEDEKELMQYLSDIIAQEEIKQFLKYLGSL